MAIYSEFNTISLHGEFTKDDMFRSLATMHSMTKIRGYSDINLDFSGCTRAYAPQMLALCSQAQNYWRAGIDVSLKMPDSSELMRLFRTTNWAHLIDFRSHDESRFRGYTHSGAVKFSSGNEQSLAVNKMVDLLLAALQNLSRDDIRYIEWAINEVTDNVINHSQSANGGIIQVTNIRPREQFEIVVSDGGVGIPATLLPTHPQLRSDTEALDAAIREGVTRDKNVGQGNGLYGTWSICQKTDGQFSLMSGFASLASPRRASLSISKEAIPINGTILAARIGYGEKFDLSEALTFSGKKYVPVDYIDTHFQQDSDGNIQFSLKDESIGFGSRAAGDPVRRKLANLSNVTETVKTVVDMSGVPLISSSYADEVFGKLFVVLGPLQFMSRVVLINVDPLVRNLIDRAIMQRMAAGLDNIDG
jgi:anti-sigma regulatory factor (Ser/Thr protein kinase)